MPSSAFAWAEFADAWIAYHRPSGTTHLLNAVAVTMIRQVLVQPKTAADAAAELAAEQGASSDERFVGSVRDMLDRLEQIGLVEPCDD